MGRRGKSEVEIPEAWRKPSRDAGLVNPTVMRCGIVTGVVVLFVVALAYAIPPVLAERLVAGISGESALGLHLAVLRERFSAYASPANGVLGILGVWIASPALFAAGYVLSREWLKASAQEAAWQRGLLPNVFLALLMALLSIGMVYGAIELPGIDPGTGPWGRRCPRCESGAMWRMLAINAAMLFSAGVVLQAARAIQQALKAQRSR